MLECNTKKNYTAFKLMLNADIIGVIASYGYNQILDVLNLAATCKDLYITIRYTDSIWRIMCEMYGLSITSSASHYEMFIMRMQFEQSQLKKLKTLTLTTVDPQLYHFYCFKRWDIRKQLKTRSLPNGLYEYQFNNYSVQATNQTIVLLDSIIVNYIQQINNKYLFPLGNVITTDYEYDFDDPIASIRYWKELTLIEAKRELTCLVASPGIYMANINNIHYYTPLANGHEFIGFHSFDTEMENDIGQQEQLYMVDASTLIRLTLDTVQASTARFFNGVHFIKDHNLVQLFVSMDNNLILVWCFDMQRNNR